MTAPDPTDVETPVGYVDVERARANARRVADYAARHGLAWRPHIKTHKSTALARIQLDAGASGLTVATPREAEVMSALTRNLLLAYPPVGAEKVRRVVKLAARVDLEIALDSEDALRPLAAAARESGDATIGVLVEQDVGLGRVGVQTADGVVRLARAVEDTGGVRFRGVLFYPGHLRGSEEERARGLADVSEHLSATLAALHEAGLPPSIVSGGSTPTLWQSHLVEGMTEIRSGSCIFHDREGLDLGVARTDEVAYTVLATVVSTAVPGHAVVDAGSKALAKEERGGAGAGYGFVLEHPEVRVSSLSEEHGVLDVSGSDWRPRVGERVRLVPNHVCVSVNLQDALLARDGERHAWIGMEGRGRGPWTG